MKTPLRWFMFISLILVTILSTVTIFHFLPRK